MGSSEAETSSSSSSQGQHSRGFSVEDDSKLLLSRSQRVVAGVHLDQGEQSWVKVAARFFWQGGSTFDAWLNSSSSQVAQVLLTFPYSLAQMGLYSGITFMLLYATMGCWACYTITCLYADYRKMKESESSTTSSEHPTTIQWHEVLEGLLGSWWKTTGLIFNGSLLFCTATIQLIACGSTVYYISDSLDKRSWTLVFGACCSLSILIPTAHNYRMWSFVGIILITYTSWYLTFASLVCQKEETTHEGPRSMPEYFQGATNFLYAFGGHAITVEIMDAMWKPARFKTIYLYSNFYIVMLTALPSAVTVYTAFGDKMLLNPNAFGVLPRSKYRDAAVILMLIHQFIEFGLLALPIYLIWEKVLRIHHHGKKRAFVYYLLRVAARIPVVLAIWFFALMVPFFGPVNSTVGSLLTSFGIYIIPCAAHMKFYWSAASRSKATEQPPKWIPFGWLGVYCVNAGIVLWVFVVGTGFGAWASIQHLKQEIDTFGLFAKCYQCHNETQVY